MQYKLTFNADDMLTHLLLKQWIMYGIDEVIQCIDAWVHTLKPLDLLSDCHNTSIYS